jgi:hypothetical protein
MQFSRPNSHCHLLAASEKNITTGLLVISISHCSLTGPIKKMIILAQKPANAVLGEMVRTYLRLNKIFQGF